MTYTKYGPFTNGSATPPINAQFLNALETFLGSTNILNGVTGWYHADQYGAVGDGTTDDRAAIQAALTAAGAAYTLTGARQTVYLPGKVYLVGVTNYLNVDGTTINGITSLMIPDGVIFTGSGTIKVKAMSYGAAAYYRCLSTKSSGSSYITISGITVDGNKANQNASTGNNAGNILIEAVSNIELSDVKSINSNGNAIMVRGTTSAAATHLKITHCRVDAANGIGIQASQFDGLDITENDVSYTTDNCIDVYGENGTTTSNGINFRISNNRVRGGAVGIFPETSALGIVANNQIWTCTAAGVHVNRINGLPTHILIIGNQVSGTPTGAIFTGDMGEITFRGNTISDISQAGVYLGDGGSGNCSYVNVMDNTINSAAANATPLVLAAGGTISNIRIRGTITNNSNRAFDYIVQSGTTVTGNTVSAANAT